MKRRIPLILWLSMALLLLACSGDDALSPEASAEVETPEPAQAPLPIELTREPVRWVPATVLGLASASELQRPFDEFLRQNGRPTATQPMWGLYVVEGSGEPAEVLSTPRLLNGIDWQSARSLSIDFETVRTAPASAISGMAAFRWRGEWRYDLGSRTATERLEPLPSSFAVEPRPTSLFALRPVMQLDQARQKLLIWIGRVPPGTTPRSYELTDVLMVDAPGRQRRLAGISGLRSVMWVPNGKAIIGWRGSGASNEPFDLLLIPGEDGDAIVVHNATFFTVQHGVDPATADGRVAFVARGSGGSSRSYLAVYDSVSRRMRVVGSVPDSSLLSWPVGSERLLAGDLIFDLQTGNSQPGTFADIYPIPWPEYASPSGRLAATLEEPQIITTEVCPGLPRKLSLTDKQTGATRTLLECPTGTSGFLQWLSESKLIGGFAACWGCESIPSRLWLFDLERDTAQSLTNGLEDWASLTPSPDKKRLLVGGDRLRLYNSDGTLLRDYGARPDGYIFDSASWAPDGSAFAFILRPTSWPVGP